MPGSLPALLPAEVAELADALHSGCSTRQGVEVRVLSSAPVSLPVTVSDPDVDLCRSCLQESMDLSHNAAKRFQRLSGRAFMKELNRRTRNHLVPQFHRE